MNITEIQTLNWTTAPRLGSGGIGIHDDSNAQSYGFDGGFVGGVSLYEHFVGAFLDQGIDWLSSGTASYRFRLPVYDGEEVHFSIDASTKTFEIIGNDDKGPRMLGTFGLDADPVQVPAGEAMQPIDVRLGEESHLGSIMQLEIDFNDQDFSGPNLSGFPNIIDGRNTIPAGKWTNPIDLITTHFDELTTIHRTGRIWHHSPLFAGEVLVKRGIINELYEHRGNKVVRFSVEQTTSDGRPIATIEHESVYRLARAQS